MKQELVSKIPIKLYIAIWRELFSLGCVSWVRIILIIQNQFENLISQSHLYIFQPPILFDRWQMVITFTFSSASKQSSTSIVEKWVSILLHQILFFVSSIHFELYFHLRNHFWNIIIDKYECGDLSRFYSKFYHLVLNHIDLKAFL